MLLSNNGSDLALASSLIDFARGDPGETIVAGQASESSAPALESLGALALGATGLLASRRWQRAK